MHKEKTNSAESTERQRLKALALANRELKQEIVRRHKVEL